MSKVKLKVRLLPENKLVEVEVEAGEKVSKLLERLGLTRESYIVLADGAPIPETERVPLGSDIVVLRVVSGG